MPNKQGGYGGYRDQKPQNKERRVRAPGTGGVRRGVTPEDLSEPRTAYSPENAGQNPRSAPQEEGPAPGWYRPEDVAQQFQQPQQPRQPRQTARPPLSEARTRAAARRARERRRARTRLTVVGTVVCIFVLAGIITLLLPQEEAAPETAPQDTQTETLTEQLVAPLPYAGAQGDSVTGTPAVDWGTVGPAQQTAPYTYTALPADSPTLPECGRVETSWFADAAFLGDSLTVGFSDYDIDVGGALILGYEGARPNQIVNRTTMTNAEGTEEVPLDVLAAAQPAKLYLLLGTNALDGNNDEGFLNYYDRMLDELRAILPNAMIFVQSVLPVRPEALESVPGLAPDHLASINASIQQMCADKGLYYLALDEVFKDESGALLADYAQPDGIHLSVAGSCNWVSYLCTHVPYNKNNPYQPGSTYYLDDSLKNLLSDLP